MSVNKVILVGNVGKDPEVRYVDQNTPVANLTLATTERGYTTQSGTVIPDRTEWHNVVVWRGLAKVVEGYVRKGTSLYIEGKIRTRNWQDQNGATRYTTEIYADDLQLLGKRPEGGVAPLAAPQAGTQQPQPASPVSAPSFDSDNGDSSGDLPF